MVDSGALGEAEHLLKNWQKMRVTHSSSALYVDSSEGIFYIKGVEHLYDVMDYEDYEIDEVAERGIIILSDNIRYALKLNGNEDIENFRVCCEVLREMKELVISMSEQRSRT